METISLQQSLRFRRAELDASVYTGMIFRESSGSWPLLLWLFCWQELSYSFLQGFLISNGAKSGVNSIPVASAAGFSSSPVSQMLGINIANNGLIFVQGSRITAISGNTINVDIPGVLLVLIG